MSMATNTADFTHSENDDAARWQQAFWWLFGLTALAVFAGMGWRDPWPPDEPRFALMARDMVASGQWFFPFRGGEIYPDKPPLVMWAMAAFYALTGNLKVAFLLPSALASLATLWLTFDLGKRLWNPRIGFQAAFLLAITLQFVLQAKSGQLDAPVAFFVMLGFYGLMRHLLLGPQWRWYYTGWFFMGLGIITKGVGFLPVLLLPVVLFYRPEWLKSQPGRWWQWALGPVFLLLAVSLWLVPMLWQVAHSQNPDWLAYRDNILFRQTVDRYARSWGHLQPWWYFLVSVIPFFWLPQSLLALASLGCWKAAFGRRELRIIYPLLWVALVVLFFSLSRGKRAEYLLPALPGLALALAPCLPVALQKRWLRLSLWELPLVFSLFLAVVGVAGLLQLNALQKAVADYGVTPDLWWWLLLTGSAGAVVSVALRRKPLLAWAGFAFALWLSVGFGGWPIADRAMSTQGMMNALQTVMPPEAELGIVRFREKLLLHAPWPVTHFGYHTPTDIQQQAAINWLAQSNKAQPRFVLVNSHYLQKSDRSCFDVSRKIPYPHWASKKWWLFDASGVSPQCPVTAKSLPAYSQPKNKHHSL
jgi:4-amino-4-deoxy-L-arabinose transferase-like glycosyltransferase